MYHFLVSWENFRIICALCLLLHLQIDDYMWATASESHVSWALISAHLSRSHIDGRADRERCLVAPKKQRVLQIRIFIHAKNYDLFTVYYEVINSFITINFLYGFRNIKLLFC